MRSALITLVVYSLAFGYHGQATAQSEAFWAIPALEALEGDHVSHSDSLIQLSDSLTKAFQKAQMPCYAVKSLIRKSQLCIKNMWYEEASHSLVKARKIFDEASCKPELLPSVYLVQANLYLKLMDFNKCDSLCSEIINMFQPYWSNQEVLVNAYLNWKYNDTNLSEVMPNLDSAYALVLRYNLDEVLEQKILINRGALYAMNGMTEEAQRQLIKALKVARQMQSFEDIALLYNNLAGLESDPKKMLMYIDSAVYYARESGDVRNLQYFIQNRALAYKKNGDLNKAYDDLWISMELKDTLYTQDKYKAIAEIEEKYESEKRESEIKSLKLETLNSEVEKLKYKRNQSILFVGAFVLALVALFFAYSFVSIRKNRNLLAVKNQEISRAIKRSDELLLNILPPEVADELKQTGKSEAKYYKQVTILFTDLIDFTKSAEIMSTKELVQELNFCFKNFDAITEKYGIEKIKTIGDAYMIAGGIPVPTDDSVKRTIEAALEMQEFINKRKDELAVRDKNGFEMRAGLHTGPVVAGIVGVKKFQYDLWGDTVNTASRLETSSAAGKVNISETTYNLIKDDPDFAFENRGEIEVKGKGKLSMYYVSRVAEAQ